MAKRPVSGMSLGGTRTSAPSCVAFATVESQSETAKYTASKMEDLIRSDPDSILYATVGSEPAGFSISTYDDGLIWLAWFGVAAQQRDKGIGSQLLNHTIDRARTATPTCVKSNRELQAAARRRSSSRWGCFIRRTNSLRERSSRFLTVPSGVDVSLPISVTDSSST